MLPRTVSMPILERRARDSFLPLKQHKDVITSNMPFQSLRQLHTTQHVAPSPSRVPPLCFSVSLSLCRHVPLSLCHRVALPDIHTWHQHRDSTNTAAPRTHHNTPSSTAQRAVHGSCVPSSDQDEEEWKDEGRGRGKTMCVSVCVCARVFAGQGVSPGWPVPAPLPDPSFVP